MEERIDAGNGDDWTDEQARRRYRDRSPDDDAGRMRWRRRIWQFDERSGPARLYRANNAG